MEDISVALAAEALKQDYERQEESLSQDRVERLLSKRGLSVSQRESVYSILDDMGVPVDLYDTSDNQLALEFHINEDNGSSVSVIEHISGLKHRLLTPEEETRLARDIAIAEEVKKSIKEGSEISPAHKKYIDRGNLSKNELILCNLRLVFSISKKFVGYDSNTLDDIFQYGVLGLIRATEKFDGNLGYRFSTYATHWIYQAVQRNLVNSGTTIRIPIHISKEIILYKKAKRLLKQLNGSSKVTFRSLSEELAWDIDKISFIDSISRMSPVLLEQDGSIGNANFTPTGLIEENTPEKLYEDLELQATVDRVLGKLTVREAKILRLRFGLGYVNTPQTLEQIGTKFNLTRERIRQIESETLKKLRVKSIGKSLRDYGEQD
ncbi:RNA polymerase sigma factor RpoD/SigA [Vibrio parahaemolyticus]|uniref:sigma-70 family RNA polymerase sigma factor n=1 Tax=Vibrio parahaemolyticus TaxID=670 RepID=UPI0023630144|nr:RNA polymerase sigma factor RpoD/SigA [Vibrio parahaemolyticus]MDG3412083.1 RNA polymerase sigma factor RpoD/SigA [Vibrio parahaemolyticus]